MGKKSPRQAAEEHWIYTKRIIDAVMELVHVAYVEAMIHGWKHGREEVKDIE